MSEVYLTLVQGGLGGFQKLVAVKLLRRDLAEDDGFRRMFLEEARLTARLNHPNVVQTNDVGEDGGRYYIAMEYLEGQTFERVRRARNASKLFPQTMQLAMLADVVGLDDVGVIQPGGEPGLLEEHPAEVLILGEVAAQ